ncbi:MAG TPA: glutamine--fructose-6-phosphate transaminase (isomerizing) [Candidatus Altiarchaeales archaeon]|nr:glutamine--fructose-6-phosphate transaminase (isomerizing) [Candidatus Altiarchaeales archaeon]HEX55469.1 glutamine--fructose-6-phosphate transaminase (isomerizing) [Candidatus Altiarchaeales archaeon]
MCGIAGYVGKRNAMVVLYDMLKRLEYRGYDSAGIAVIAENEIVFVKDRGKVSNLKKRILNMKISSNIGIAHTRWATHGIPSSKNAHPHSDCSGEITIVHNGIIENYRELKQELIERGHKFTSETDTEVIPHLIEELYKRNRDIESAFVSAIKKLRGSFAIAVINKHDDKILIARRESPLIVGLGNGENFIASDMPAILPNTKRIIILNDFEYGIISKDSVVIRDLTSQEIIEKEIQRIELSLEEAEKGGYRHFMLKEIFEEPDAIRNALRSIDDIKRISEKLKRYERIYFVACGTASYAALYAKYLLERFGIPSEAIIGSEFRYSTVNVINDKCAVVLISQSGETADTIASAREAKRRKAYVVSVVNVVGSSLTRISDDTIYIFSGPEIAVASTKAYIGQLTSLALLCLNLAFNLRKIDDDYINEMIHSIEKLPEKVEDVLKKREEIENLAKKLKDRRIFFYIGRRFNYPTALEGALKIKEISYVHAEAYPAGEMKHGPLALLEKGVTVIAIKPNDDIMEKMESNIEEARARNADVIVVSEDGDIRVPVVDPILSPILYIVPLHLLAYYISTIKGLDPDKPRNLAKSVTVE